MRCLPYCIFASADAPHSAPPAGVDGLPVAVVSDAGLAAAVSTFSVPMPDPEVSRFIAFENVVEWFHRDRTVLPFRYGCFLENSSRMRAILRERRDEYRELLDRLEGMVEMGIRILRTEAGWRPAPASGTAYLALRRSQYAAAEGLADRLCVLLSGAFVRSHRELSRSDGASVQFLVERGSVTAFREAVRNIRGNLPGELLLSGPWPPYSFVGVRHG